MPLSEISAYHPLVIIGFGIALGIIYFITKHGFSSGAGSLTGGESKNAAQVVAIAADTKALDRVKDSGDRLADTLASFEKTYDEHSEQLERRMEDFTEAIKSTNYELRELGKELRNRSR